MRPIPRSRHLLAVLIFAGAAAVSVYLGWRDDRFSKTQISIATVAIKRATGPQELFANDAVFGTSGRWRFHTPLNQALLEMILVPAGYHDLTIPFRAMTGVLVMIYLCGMYALLYRQCRSWSISAFVAVLSSAVTYTLGKSFWGVGSLGSITPPTLVMAMIPLIVLSYLRYENQWRVVLVFAFVGVFGNLHLVTAMNLTIVLLIVYLGRHRFAPSSWPTAIACGLASLGTALPYTGYYLHLRYSSVPVDAEISAAAVYEAFRVGKWALLYPDMLKSLLYWGLYVLVLLIPAAAVLLRIERFRVRGLTVWVYFAAGALFVSLGLHGISQLVGFLRGQWPPIIDFAQGSNLVMLPLYVLFAQALTNLFRLARSHRDALRWACAIFFAAWMIPSDNLRVARHMVYDLATAWMEEDQKPLRVQELHAKVNEKSELSAIAHWARRTTDVNAVFLTNDVKFRMMSRRAIAASPHDVKYYYYTTPWELDDWVKRVENQRAVLRGLTEKVDGSAIARFVADLKNNGFPTATDWYVILPPSVVPESPSHLEPIEGAGWGEYYRLYRIR
jgi:hypothetical protein